MTELNENTLNTHDPWDGPDPQRIKPEDSIFFNEAEKAVMSHPLVLDQVENGKLKIPEDPLHQTAFAIISSTLSSDPNAKKRLKDFIEESYPLSYQQVVNSLNNFHLEPRSPLGDRLVQLKKDIDAEYKLPDNISLTVRFHIHAIEDPSNFNTYKNAYKDMVKRIFNKDEKNIYLGESIESIKGKNKSLERAYQKYGSYTKASFVVGTYDHSGRIPSEEEVERETQVMARQARIYKDPDRAFSIMEKEVIDELIEEGYDIKYIFETGVPWSKEAKESFESNRITSKDNANYLKLIVPLSVKREREIVKQVEEIEKNASEQTNILVTLGINHQHTLKYGIPLRYIPVTRFEIAQESNDRPEVLEMIDELARTGKVGDESVEKAFPGATDR